MDTYKTSAGKVVKITEMNPHHLANAIKKMTAAKAADMMLLAALRAEQEWRGGPPEGAK